MSKQKTEETTVEGRVASVTQTPETDTQASGDNGALPATTFAPSGAPEQTVVDVDPDHPAVDNDPRAGTTAEQNQIDFNDPTISGAEAVERNLASQSKD